MSVFLFCSWPSICFISFHLFPLSMEQGKMFFFIGITMAVIQGGYTRQIKPGNELNTVKTVHFSITFKALFIPLHNLNIFQNKIPFLSFNSYHILPIHLPPLVKCLKGK